MRRFTKALLVALPLLAACGQAGAATLLIGNKGEDTVSFIDLETGRERARAPTARWPHEIAVSPDGKQAAVVAYGGTTIDIFDVAGASLVKRIDLAPNARPHGLVWLKDGLLLATTEGSQTLTIVDPRTGKVEAVPTGQATSHMVAVTADGTLAYVANISAGTVSVIDVPGRRKLADIAVGGKPEGLALSLDGKELWVGDLGAPRVQVIDTATLKSVAEVALDPVAIRVAVSPDGRTVVTSNVLAGTVSEIDRASRKVRRTISVSGTRDAGQVTLLFSADGSRLYAAETGRDQIAEIDMKTGAVLRRLPAGKNGDGLGIAP
jgi:YVTN family beta-propeller protein